MLIQTPELSTFFLKKNRDIHIYTNYTDSQLVLAPLALLFSFSLFFFLNPRCSIFVPTRRPRKVCQDWIYYH